MSVLLLLWIESQDSRCCCSPSFFLCYCCRSSWRRSKQQQQNSCFAAALLSSAAHTKSLSIRLDCGFRKDWCCLYVLTANTPSAWSFQGLQRCQRSCRLRACGEMRFAPSARSLSSFATASQGGLHCQIFIGGGGLTLLIRHSSPQYRAFLKAGGYLKHQQTPPLRCVEPFILTFVCFTF